MNYSGKSSASPGFTLIEMLVVITIMGVLASLIGPGFWEYQRHHRLQLSQQLVETMIAEGFSQARSRPNVFSVSMLGGSGVVVFETCDYKPKETFTTCDNPVERRQSLEGEVTVAERFTVRFFPPHGDMQVRDQAGNVVDKLTITLQNPRGEKRQTRLHAASGFVETLIPGLP